MIKRFRHKGLEALFTSGRSTRGVNVPHARKLRLILAALHTAAGPANMDLPGFRLHPLKGGRKGQWAVAVSGNWRVVFGTDATSVDLVDYY
jgi:proteic killer suppression protein